MSWDGIDSVVWKEGCVHVPNCKSFLVREAERKHVRRRARFQQHRGGAFSTCDAPRLGRSKTMTIPEIIDQIHELILEDRHLFPGLKKQLKGRHVSSEAEVIAAAETWLGGQSSEFF